MTVPRVAALFPILAFSLALKSVTGFLPEPLSVFKDQSPYYGYTDGNQRVDHIFNLLADVPQASEVTALERDQLDLQPVLTQDSIREEARDRDVHFTNAIDDSSIVYKDEFDGGSSTYMDMLRSLLKKSLQATKKVEDVFDTVQKVTRIYQDERRKIVHNATALQRMGLENEPKYDPNTSTVNTLLNVALDPPSLIRMVEVSRSSTSEDDILEGLTAVLLGAEARSGGSALTLDPVTIIALLTLAAYLIRAVYQILANNGRSLASTLDGLPLGLSELPDFLVTVHNYISGTDYSRESYARSLQESEGDPNSVQGLLALPGSLAAFTKLIREGHQGCAKLYVCDQLTARSLFSYSFEDIVVAGLGYYYADADVWRLVSRAPGDESDSDDDACTPHRARCDHTTLAEARRIRDLFTKASSKLVRFWGATTVAKRKSLARAATTGGALTVDTN